MLAREGRGETPKESQLEGISLGIWLESQLESHLLFTVHDHMGSGTSDLLGACVDQR